MEIRLYLVHHFLQALTTLRLRGNDIGPAGTKYLTDAQKERTVGHTLFCSFYCDVLKFALDANPATHQW
jgi:hypothetical protein